MNLYRITANRLRYDDFTSITVRASNEDEARKTAARYVEQAEKDAPPCQFARVWLDPDQSQVTVIPLWDGPQVISAQFRHG
jgi:hypothetical protein